MIVGLIGKPQFLTRINNHGERKINTISLISFSLLLSVLMCIVMYVMQMPSSFAFGLKEPSSSPPLQVKGVKEQTLSVEKTIPCASFHTTAPTTVAVQ